VSVEYCNVALCCSWALPHKNKDVVVVVVVDDDYDDDDDELLAGLRTVDHT